MNYKEYYDLIKPTYITWEFYSKYTILEPPFSKVGRLVYLRTYSRFIESLKRREKWCEICLRVVEYSLSLDAVSSFHDKQQEAEDLFDNLFNLVSYVAGRTYWVGGTEQTKKDPSANWNCVYRNLDDLSAFTELFYWLLIGAGSGFSVEKKCISKLPKSYPNKTITHLDYVEIENKCEDTRIEMLFNDDVRVCQLTKQSLTLSDSKFEEFYIKYAHTLEKAIIIIGDSKEGWCNALRLYFHLLTLPYSFEIEFNYNNIRSKGKRIKTFGGRASGYVNIKRCIELINDELLTTDGVFTSVAALTIMCIIGDTVVSAGVRRTAEDGLGDKDDTEFIEAKYGIYDDNKPELVKYRNIRDKSNNSVMYYERPSYEELEFVINRARYNGEPGLCIIGNAQKFDSDISGYNPCVTGDTLVKTTSGDIAIKDLVDKEVEIWDGVRWVLIDNFRVTGYNKPVFTVKTAHGNVTATSYHKFVLADNAEKELCNLVVGDKLKFSTPEGSYKSEIYAIEPAGVESKVYCCTVPTNHRFTLANNMLIGQCFESGLHSKQSCNLTTNNLRACVVESDGKYTLDLNKWYKSLYLTTRVASRQTTATQWHPEWDKVQKQQRLLGVSITGLIDTVDVLGWSNEQLAAFLDTSKNYVRKVADEYHDALGIERSARVTLIKPEGSLSKLTGVSEGVHRAYARHYINRIRFGSNDPLAKVLFNEGVPVSPENGQGDDLFASNCNTWVFKFAVKSDTKQRYIDESAIAQLERYKLVQQHWVDGGHNCSITVSVYPYEWDDVIKWVYDNWKYVIAVSFLERFDPTEGSNTIYPNIPKEACTYNQYKDIDTLLPDFKEDELIAKVAEFEQEDDEYALDSSCDSGFCPSR